MKKIVVVGSGIGGLATALRLSSRGFQVEVIEKYSQAGGRLNTIEVDGFKFDTGPTFFSMPYEFEELARDCGMQLPFKYVELDPLYTVSYGNAKTYAIYRDKSRLAQQFIDREPDFEYKLRRYLEKCRKRYYDTVDNVVKRNFDSLLEYFIALLRVNPVHIPLLFRSFWEEVSRYFDTKEAREIMSLIAFFLGRTPFDTMGIYTLLSYVEFDHTGYYNVDGGMYRIVEGIVEELQRRGVRFHYGREVVDFESEGDERILCLIDQTGCKWYADAFVINADAASFRGQVFKRKKYSMRKLDAMQWTSGYLTIYLGVTIKLPQLHQHNYFLGDQLEKYARMLLQDPSMQYTPYYYVNVVSKNNLQAAPEGCEALSFVCPVPNLLVKKDWTDRERIVDTIISDFCRRIGLDIRPYIAFKSVWTPIEWQSNFNLYRGSGLGLAHTMWQVGGFRPPNYDEQFKNVFYVGASTIPGAGIPMAVISSKLVVERCLQFIGI